MRYRVYLDVFWVTNFAMDALVLLLVRQLRKHSAGIWRIFLSAGFGATAAVFLFLQLPGWGWYQLLLHAVVNPWMVLIGLGKKKPKEFGADLLWTYGITLLLGGVLNWGMEAFGQWEYFWLWVLVGSFACLLAAYGIKRQQARRECFEVLLLTGREKLQLTGFLDTGNLLIDPFVHQPVHIIQEDLLETALEEEQMSIRYIPFHSLGKEQGMLPVVTLPAMYIRETEGNGKETVTFVERPVFGLAREKLFQNRDYQVILNAKYDSR